MRNATESKIYGDLIIGFYEMMIAAVGFGPLGLLRGAFSGPAAVGWNSAYIAAAGGDGTPGGLVEK